MFKILKTRLNFNVFFFNFKQTRIACFLKNISTTSPLVTNQTIIAQALGPINKTCSLTIKSRACSVWRATIKTVRQPTKYRGSYDQTSSSEWQPLTLWFSGPYTGVRFYVSLPPISTDILKK